MRIAIIGGGPGGYEAALVAADLGAEVTIIDRAGLGGACVLWDCVPSKTLCSTAEVVTWMEAAPTLGLSRDPLPIDVNLHRVFERVLWLATAQSTDVEKKVSQAGVRIVRAHGRFVDPHTIHATAEGTVDERISADAILIATGSSPRVLPAAEPDGERILTGRQVYNLREIPEHLLVVGSGATGAEFTHAFNRLGSRVTLVSSRDHVLPAEDTDAALVLEEVFTRRGVEILKRARAAAARRAGDGVEVELTDGRILRGSHALITVGQVPNSDELDLERAGVRSIDGGAIPIDGVSRTTVPHIYAAGDVTGSMMLASVAAMQGRIAMWHALGQAVTPFHQDEVAATVFTDPEIATAGVSEPAARARGLAIDVIKLPFATNARAKMVGLEDGFVKLVVAAHSRAVLGGTIVAPHASDLILPVAVAVHARLDVAQLAQSFSIYPSFGGSIQEAARRLMSG